MTKEDVIQVTNWRIRGGSRRRRLASRAISRVCETRASGSSPRMTSGEPTSVRCSTRAWTYWWPPSRRGKRQQRPCGRLRFLAAVGGGRALRNCPRSFSCVDLWGVSVVGSNPTTPTSLAGYRPAKPPCRPSLALRQGRRPRRQRPDRSRCVSSRESLMRLDPSPLYPV